MFDFIAFDADDTLWENNALYTATRERIKAIIAPYADADISDEIFDEVEVGNLKYYGYGVLSFITYRSIAEVALPRALDRLATQATLSASKLEAALNGVRRDVLMIQSGIGVAQLAAARTTAPAGGPTGDGTFGRGPGA